MSNKLKQLEIKKLLSEYDYLIIDEEIKTEILDEFLPIFTEGVRDLTKDIEGKKDRYTEKDKGIKLEGEENKDKKVKKVIEDELLPKETIVKIKKLFREIVKKTHPDKVNSEDLIEIYINTKDAYEANDILKLTYYANKLSIDVELSDLEIELLRDLIRYKKEELLEIELSWVWKWYKCETKSEQDKIIKLFYLSKKNK